MATYDFTAESQRRNFYYGILRTSKQKHMQSCTHCREKVNAGFDYVMHCILKHRGFASTQLELIANCPREILDRFADPRQEECITIALAWRLSQ